MKLSWTLVTLSLGLFSHSLAASNDVPTAYFKCGAKDVMADFYNGDKLDLTIGHTTYVLSVTRSGSGARYETPKGASPHVLFWNKGEEATIEINEKALPKCYITKAPIHPLLTSYKQWTVLQINGQKLIKDSKLFILLGKEGTISGFSGCNNFSGLYELDGENIKIQSLASTEMACLDSRMMEQESQFMSLLQSVSFAKIRDGKYLELSNSKGQLIKLEH